VKTNQRRLLTVKETSDYLGISARSIYNQLSGKKFAIRPLRLGRSVRFDLWDLDSYIEGLKK
jgi:excisionase family DNA binding protein